MDPPRWDAGEILPSRLFVGSLVAANETHALKTHGVTHILTVGSRLKLSWRPEQYATKETIEEIYDHPPVAQENIRTIEIDDHPAESLLPVVQDCYDFIDGAIDDTTKVAGCVLVHCASGISRSVAVCCAYLMLRDRVPYDQALASVRKERPMAHPNFGFERQLRCLEKSHYDLGKSLALFEQLEEKESSTDTVQRCRDQANKFHAEVDRVEEEIMAAKSSSLLRKQDRYILDLSMLQNRIDNYMTDQVRETIGDRVTKWTLKSASSKANRLLGKLYSLDVVRNPYASST